MRQRSLCNTGNHIRACIGTMSCTSVATATWYTPKVEPIAELVVSGSGLATGNEVNGDNTAAHEQPECESIFTVTRIGDSMEFDVLIRPQDKDVFFEDVPVGLEILVSISPPMSNDTEVGVTKPLSNVDDMICGARLRGEIR